MGLVYGGMSCSSPLQKVSLPALESLKALCYTRYLLFLHFSSLQNAGSPESEALLLGSGRCRRSWVQVNSSRTRTRRVFWEVGYTVLVKRFNVCSIKRSAVLDRHSIDCKTLCIRTNDSRKLIVKAAEAQ